ncbi:hypothetical protein SDC9_147367 [bioreactor metagenome]|uniref:Uncharacterized protein n=1 Tax=bioreactor metagenome TaxID=1076179 RepID=A0A645EHU4_9ZZZZ
MIFRTFVNSSIVHLHNSFTLLTVRLVYSIFHLTNSLLVRDNVCDFEECRLKDSVGSVSKTNLLSNLSSIDNIESKLFLSDSSFDIFWKFIHSLFYRPKAVQKESAFFLDTLKNIVFS